MDEAETDGPVSEVDPAGGGGASDGDGRAGGERGAADTAPDGSADVSTAGDAGVDTDAEGEGPAAPEKLFTAEGDFLFIWGVMAALVTVLEYFSGGPPTVLLSGAIAAVVSLGAAAANATRRFRPTTGLYALVTLAAAVGALVAYSGEALVTAAGLGVVALANGGRVYELGYRGSDSLLDPVRDDGSGEDDEGEASEDENTDADGEGSAEPTE